MQDNEDHSRPSVSCFSEDEINIRNQYLGILGIPIYARPPPPPRKCSKMYVLIIPITIWLVDEGSSAPDIQKMIRRWKILCNK